MYRKYWKSIGSITADSNTNGQMIACNLDYVKPDKSAIRTGQSHWCGGLASLYDLPLQSAVSLLACMIHSCNLQRAC